MTLVEQRVERKIAEPIGILTHTQLGAIREDIYDKSLNFVFICDPESDHWAFKPEMKIFSGLSIKFKLNPDEHEAPIAATKFMERTFEAPNPRTLLPFEIDLLVDYASLYDEVVDSKYYPKLLELVQPNTSFEDQDQSVQ